MLRLFHGVLAVYKWTAFLYAVCVIFPAVPSLKSEADGFLDALCMGCWKFLTTWSMVSIELTALLPQTIISSN